MEYPELPGIEFYVHKEDRNKVFAEYVIPALDENLRDKLMLAPISSKCFESFLRGIYLSEDSGFRSPKDVIEWVNDTNNLYPITDRITPRVRAAGNLTCGLIEYALYDRYHSYIQVKPDGWKRVATSKNKFLATAETQSQKAPKKTGDDLLNLLGKYINTDRDSKILFIAWLVQAFCTGNHSALLIMADKGCGKTTLTKMIRRILDPSRVDSVVFPSKADNLLTTLTNSYLVAFDNVDEINKDASDILCAAITGSSYSKREYFTTNSMAVFSLHNTVIMNGIDITPAESDFAERSLLLKLQKITGDKRKTDSDIMTRFNQDLPGILGAIFNTLSKAMTIINDLEITKLPRMAESYRDMLAIAIALGVSQDEFTRIYNANIDTLNKVRANSDTVMAVKDYMASIPGRSVEGTANQIYNKIRTAIPNKSALPNSASHFSRRLRAEYASLQAVGLTVNFDDTYADGTHIKIIKNNTGAGTSTNATK